ncbi:MAG: SLBB domain-containing protein [Candidatus Krumholzibacteria bacterium]|nr:SLBB domain-containing protein [Candidatus Krumholzibacteria bacterium]
MSVRTCVLAGLLAVALPPLAVAQQAGWDPRRVYASREALETLSRRYDAAAESPAYSPVLRAQARRQADDIRGRLAAGDFRVGDRLFLSVEREEGLTDTLAVAAGTDGPVIVLPNFGAVSLRGVLRSEAEDHLQRFIARFIREPVVRARAFIRVSVAGEVTRPGFYSVPTDLVVSDALAIAQGVTANADLTNLEIRRQNQVLWDASALREPVAEGQTLDQLDIRSGDQIVVGRRGGVGVLGGLESPLRVVSILLALPLTVVGLLSLF